MCNRGNTVEGIFEVPLSSSTKFYGYRTSVMYRKLKFGDFEKRVAIVALYDFRMMVKIIRQLLKPLLLNKRFVSQTLAHYRETGDIIDWPREGLPKCVYT